MTGRFYYQHFQKWKAIVTLQWTHFFQVIIVNFRDRSILTFYFIFGIINEGTEIALTSLEKMYWRTCSLTLKYHNLSSCLSGNLFYLSLYGMVSDDRTLIFHSMVDDVTLLLSSSVSPICHLHLWIYYQEYSCGSQMLLF